jgi:hypothetical protein
MITPFLRRLNSAKRVLIAGCGGGFDVYVGVPLAIHLLERGASLAFANLSFTNLPDCGGEQIDPVTWRVDQRARELPYFPEKWLVEWLSKRGCDVPVYAFSQTGVKPLASAYRLLLERHNFDLVLLVDGGTDALIFGDEPGLGTIAEDASSVAAVTQAAGDRALLMCLGFGIDHFHGVSHHAFLENVARLTRDGGFLGNISLVSEMPEAEAFLDLVLYANQRRPQHRSIVCNSIASAIRGEFGDVQVTGRTGDSQLFINALMTQYWAFDAMRVVKLMKFAEDLAETTTFAEVSRAIEAQRERMDIRARKMLPL